MALLLGRRVEDVDREVMGVIARWMVVEGVAGVVEEEERVVGLVIAKPRSEYLDPRPVPPVPPLLCIDT